MMEIREATPSDIPGILEVLKASLGETSSEKTEEVWRYKHVLNPFGKSLVLLAIENAKIIGVRAFMRWKWQQGSKIFSAFRAVDTATHPDHQGKGIFKKLTLRALEIGCEEGSHFVFNTPNSQSKPGYLKMGWEVVDKLNVSISPVNPLYWKFGDLGYAYKKQWIENNPMDYIDSYNLELSAGGKLFTPKNWEYLKWRYIDNPLQDYQVTANNTYFLAGYIKQQGNIRELRISEVIISPEVSPTIFKKELKKWIRGFGIQIVSSSPILDVDLAMTLTKKIGPILTFKDLDISSEIHKEFLDLNSWSYSLGDLELF